MQTEDEILIKVTDFYRTSADFNGLPVLQLVENLKESIEHVQPFLIHLVRDGALSVLFPDSDSNTHIKRFGVETVEVQLQKLDRLNDYQSGHVCLYPTTSHLSQVVDSAEYNQRPFTLRLALGEPQLTHLAFDPSVLEFYRNDPRYYYSTDDISGWIAVHDRYGVSDQMPPRDKVLLQHFGFSYDSQQNRAVAVALRYLADLSAEHQQIWNAKLLQGDYKLHPDYKRSHILGEMPKGVSIFSAFLQELCQINEMCHLMERPPLFKRDFSEGKPMGFGFLLRPTLKEYQDFVHLLDKMLSENINQEFFMNEVALEYEESRNDGTVVVRQKGSISVLDEWFANYYTFKDRTPITEMIEALREVRRQRQRPAHALEDDAFDQQYFRSQREMIIKAYEGLRTLRLTFANHPKVKGYKYPEHLDSGVIWTQ